MNRIQHLLSPQPVPRSRWGVPAGFLVILGSGAMLLAQARPTEIPKKQPMAVTEEATPARGSNRRIWDDSDGVKRSYHKQVSLFGKVTETYTENGQPKPIDGNVRAWIQQVQTAVPSLPPEPPSPPTPPAPPAWQDTTVFKEALQQAQSDGRMKALLGAPLVQGTDVHGLMHTWGPSDIHSLWGILPSGSKADLKIPVSGPNGSAILHVSGRRMSGPWRFSKLDLVPAQGDSLNLLKPR